MDYSSLVRPKCVCVCRAVSKEVLHKHIDAGCHTLKALIQKTDCCTGCGTCEKAVLNILGKRLDKIKADNQGQSLLDLG